VNIAVVMLLGGLWHGAAWNFVIWGAIHGAMLMFERTQGRDSIYRNLPRPVKIGITFVIVMFAWVFFRSPDVGAALAYCGHMLGIGEVQAGAGLLGGIIYQPYYAGALAAAALLAWTCPQTWDFTRSITWPKAVFIVAAFIISVIALATQAYNPFIYFIF